MEYADSEASRKASGKTPYLINMELVLEDIDTDEDSQATTEGRSEGDINIISVLDKTGNDVTGSVRIRLQTLNQEEDEGYWVDTGVVCSQ